jgi:hypothetical protein
VCPVLGRTSVSAPRMLDGFVDSLVQAFENCRPGLSDEDVAAGGARVRSFFLDLYEKEVPRLRQTVAAQIHLQPTQREQLFQDVDEHVRRVVIPSYARLAARFTARERNDFYAAPPGWHAAERVGWAIAGLLLGALVVWAPFIPIWSKEWVAVFMLAGFVFPSVRRFFAFRRYQADLNAVVASADAEVWRLDMVMSTTEVTATEVPASRTGADEAVADDPADDNGARSLLRRRHRTKGR